MESFFELCLQAERRVAGGGADESEMAGRTAGGRRRVGRDLNANVHHDDITSALLLLFLSNNNIYNP